MSKATRAMSLVAAAGMALALTACGDRDKNTPASDAAMAPASDAMAVAPASDAMMAPPASDAMAPPASDMPPASDAMTTPAPSY